MEAADNFREKYQFSEKIFVKYSNLSQVLGMGGPWIGNVNINGRQLKGRYSGPPRFSENKNLILLPRFYSDKKFFGIAIQRPYFRIIVIDLKQNEIWQSNQKFNLLFIEEFKKDRIVIFEANHSKLDEYRTQIRYDLNNFSKNDDVFAEDPDPDT